MRILVAEDEKRLNQVICKQLEKEKYTVDGCYDGEDAYYHLTISDYDIAILDVNMPKMDGFTVVEKIRAEGINTSVLFLTARDSIADRVRGLDLGADDYLIKPFSLKELLARLRVLTRRKGNTKNNELTCADLVLDMSKHIVTRGGKEISLSAKEYELLQYLLMNKGIVLTRDQIEMHIWDYDYEGGTNIVDVYIRYLRKKIDDQQEVKLIRTIRGTGYVLKEGD